MTSFYTYENNSVSGKSFSATSVVSFIINVNPIDHDLKPNFVYEPMPIFCFIYII